VWLRAARTARGETAIELCAPGASPLAGTGVELARATMRSLGGDVAPGEARGGEGDAPLAVVRLGAYA
jgi:hypothetical protein